MNYYVKYIAHIKLLQNKIQSTNESDLSNFFPIIVLYNT